MGRRAAATASDAAAPAEAAAGAPPTAAAIAAMPSAAQTNAEPYARESKFLSESKALNRSGAWGAGLGQGKCINMDVSARK